MHQHCCYDNYNEVNLFKVKESVGLSKTSSINKNPYLLSGGPMMLQNILFDIMIYNPNKIFISGFNFYCSKKMYNDSYQSYRWYDDIFFVRKSYPDLPMMSLLSKPFCISNCLLQSIMTLFLSAIQAISGMYSRIS